MNRRTSLSSACLLLAASSLSAEPAPLLEEIIVTGEFRPESLARLPASISVVDARAMRVRSAQHLEDIAALVPNVNVTSGASRARYYQIRGIGERGQFEEPLNSSVGLLVDGVDFSGFGGVATLFDVSQVEVFRGPQGTRYGANALAGLINVQTGAPSETFESRLRLEGANYGTYSAGGAVSGPLSERVAGRLTAHYYGSDGFSDNNFTNDDDTNERDELTLRGKLRVELSEATVLDIMAGHIDVDNGYDVFSLDNERDTLADEPGRDEHETSFGSVKLSWSGGERFSLEGLATYADSDIGYGYDEDWVFVGFDPAGYSSTDRYDRDRQTGTFELKLLSGPEGRVFGGRTDWVVGAYGLTSDVDLTRTYTFLTEDFTSDFEIDRYAVFGELESSLTPRLTLMSGVRYERNEFDYSDSNAVGFSPDDDLFGARLALDYLVTDDLLVYVSAARGYKAGGFNQLGTLDADLREFDPEDLYNLELGLKGSWQDNRLVARLSGFYMWRDDMQVESSVVRPRPDGSSEFIQFIGNAAEGTNYGLEAELSWEVLAGLELFANVGLLFTSYDDFVNASGDDLDGRDQAQAPSYQFFAGADYQLGNGLFLRAEVEGKDNYYFSDNHDEQADSYELLNLSAGYEGEQWTITAWGRNVTDEDYFVRGFFFGNDPRDGYTPRLFTQLGEPRRYGVTVEWQL